MVRTQVYLDDKQVQEIALLAKRKRIKKAKVIRRLIDAGIKAEKKQVAVGEGLLGLVELGKKLNLTCDDPYLSQNIDKYLYEE